MRKRPLLVLSTVAAATLLLAGCSGSSAPESSGTPEPTASSSCLADLQPGTGSDAVTVDGTGAAAKVTVPAGTTLTLEAGTEVRATSESDSQGSGESASGVELIVKGSLHAEGRVAEPVILRSTSRGGG